jgi:hypothetical protein
MHKMTSTIRNSTFVFQGIGFGEGLFTTCGVYKLNFASEPIEGKSLQFGPVTLTVIPGTC